MLEQAKQSHNQLSQSYPHFCHAERSRRAQTSSNKKPFKSLELWKGFSKSYPQTCLPMLRDSHKPLPQCFKHISHISNFARRFKGLNGFFFRIVCHSDLRRTRELCSNRRSNLIIYFYNLTLIFVML
jgi:hypothetical protein